MYIHKLTYYFMSAAMGILLMAGMTSCANEDEPESVAEKEPSEYRVSFQIDLAGDASTRSIDWDRLPEEKGNTDENYIDPTTLKFYLYRGEALIGSYVGTKYGVKWYWNYKDSELVFVPDVILKNSRGLYVEGYITGEKLSDCKDYGFILAVAANYQKTEAYPAPGYGVGNSEHYILGQFCCTSPYRYSYAAGFWPSEETPIPMAGLQNIKPFTSEQGACVEIGTVKMMRAMAKIEVWPANSGITLQDVTLAKACDKGMLAPAYINDSKTRVQTLEVATDCNLNIPGDGEPSLAPGVIQNLPFQECKDANGNPYYAIYVPEYRITGTTYLSTNGGGSGYAADATNQITFTMDGESKTIEFKEYEITGETVDGSEYNILRNHIYRYTVSRAGKKVILQYMVIPWDNQTADDIIFN